ncbi:MAG: ABC transporter ATP-binding protein [Acidimicrobiales bacterium]
MTGVEIEARGLTKIYPSGLKEMIALDNLDLELRAGSFCGLVGASGSGKSTLLHLIGGMDSPTGGQLRVGAEHLESLSSKRLVLYRRRVGFVFQRFHLLPALTAVDNVAAPLLPFETFSTLHERALGLLDRVGLGDRGDALSSELSGGEQQRVAIARALISDPPLLVADEPTGNLDSATGDTILDLLEALHRDSGATIIVATHDAAVAARCESTFTMRDGRLVTED